MSEQPIIVRTQFFVFGRGVKNLYHLRQSFPSFLVLFDKYLRGSAKNNRLVLKLGGIKPLKWKKDLDFTLSPLISFGVPKGIKMRDNNPLFYYLFKDLFFWYPKKYLKNQNILKFFFGRGYTSKSTVSCLETIATSPAPKLLQRQQSYPEPSYIYWP